MNIRISWLIPIALSLSLGAALWHIPSPAPPPPPEAGAAYGVLSLDAAYEDRRVGDLLAEAGITGVLSESTLWVFLDDFGELLQIPLDAYEDRLAPFDLRNDGYAETLRAFFVHGGKRFFFIPRSPAFPGSTPEAAEEHLARALGDTPFDFEFPASPQPKAVPPFLFAAAALALALLSGFSLAGLCLLPILGALCLGGAGGFAGGFAPAAGLTALFALFRAPLGEFFAPPPEAPPQGLKGRRILTFLAAALYGGLCGFSGLPPAIGGGALLSFFLILPLALRAEASPGQTRFIPVPIAGQGKHRERGLWLPVPFAVAALAALALPSLQGGSPPSPAGEGAPPWATGEAGALEAAAYYAHADFQRSFSRRPLRYGEAGAGDGEYLRYRRGEDGLIGDALPGGDRAGGESGEIPPFPLEDLAAFLKGLAFPAKAYTPGDALSLIGVLALCVPALLPIRRGRRNKKRSLLYNEKRIAA